MVRFEHILISETATYREALATICGGCGFGLVANNDGRLLGIISERDVQQALISGKELGDRILGNFRTDYAVFDESGHLSGDAQEGDVIIPVVDREGRVVGLRERSEGSKVALITGITGQDGSYLAHFLLSLGYQVIGGYRRSSTDPLERLRRLGIQDQVKLVMFDLSDMGSCARIIEQSKPREVYNLAAQSFVHSSFNEPRATLDYTGGGVLNMLEAIRLVDCSIRFYQASSSEMYGQVRETPQRETTPFHPRSPYAVAKVYGHWITVNYRESYDLFACCGILFNHESPLRGLEFVSRKITHAAAQIKRGLRSELVLGNLNARRDWGYAYDYIKCMWMMLQGEEPKDYIIATGENHTVRELVDIAFESIGLDAERYIRFDRALYRPAEVEVLLGHPDLAETELGWNSQATSFQELVEIMVAADLRLIDGDGQVHITSPQ